MNVIPILVVFIILKSIICVFSERDLTFKFDIGSVSYTHLTLPTILRV